jgi:hypothetical protein
MGYDFKPSPKSIAVVIAKRLEGSQQLQQHDLGNIKSVGLLQSPASAPRFYSSTVSIDKFGPRLLIKRGILKSNEQ